MKDIFVTIDIKLNFTELKHWCYCFLDFQRERETEILLILLLYSILIFVTSHTETKAHYQRNKCKTPNNTNRLLKTEHIFNLNSQHGICLRSFIVNEACFHWELIVCISPAVQNTISHIRCSKCWCPASKQAWHLLTYFSTGDAALDLKYWQLLF
jgi:hypothetical protein